MSIQVTNYQCPACNGPLHFEPSIGKLKCDYCDSQFEVAEIEAKYAEKDAQAVKAAEVAEEKAEAEKQKATAEGWDTSGITDDWGKEAEGLKIYNCPSCGAELICDENTAATACPYCNNPTIIPKQFSGMLKPEFVIPFKLKKEDAIAKLKEHYKGRPFLPKAFKDQNHLEEIKGVYVPFWLFDGKADGGVSFDATKVHSRRSGDYRITTTEHYDVYREGEMHFEKVPVDGATKMPDDYMDSIEPYDYNELTEFSVAYLPGYMADKYDVSAEDSMDRANTRIKNSLAGMMRDTVIGYSSVIETHENIHVEEGKISYAMLPVWLLTTKWNDEIFLFAMNGQTGKFVGKLPTDKKRRRNIFLAIYGGGVVVVGLMGLFFGGLLDLLMM